jgi:hypothetical protein
VRRAEEILIGISVSFLLSHTFYLSVNTMSDTDRDELLKLLEAQGQQFLQNFSLPASFPASTSVSSKGKAREESEESGEEWGGIEQSSDSEDALEEGSGSGNIISMLSLARTHSTSQTLSMRTTNSSLDPAQRPQSWFSPTLSKHRKTKELM